MWWCSQRGMWKNMSEGTLPWRRSVAIGGLAVPLDLFRADPVVVLQALEVLAGDLAGGVATGIQQPDAELRLVAVGSGNQQLRVRGTEDVILAGVHVVFVAADEVEHLRLGHVGAVGEGILVVVAEGQRPLDLAGFHRLDDVVDGLLDLGGGLRLAVDDVAVDQHEVGLLGLDDLVHQFQGAPIGQRPVLGVVELHDLELAVLAELQLGAHRRFGCWWRTGGIGGCGLRACSQDAGHGRCRAADKDSAAGDRR